MWRSVLKYSLFLHRAPGLLGKDRQLNEISKHSLSNALITECPKN
jgi:hypothetical protein